MTLAFTLGWWGAPSIVTALAIAWAILWPKGNYGWFGEIVTLFRLVGALGIALIAWAVAGFFK
jgi:hypothetical protein